MAGPPPLLGEPEPFSFERLIGQAREMAAQPFQPRPPVPGWLGELPIERWRGIEALPDRLVPLGATPFRLRPAHPGAWYKVPVQIALVEGGTARSLLYDPAMFDLGEIEAPEPVPPDVGWAGFNLLYPMGSAEGTDELLTFLGASYFRAVARGSRFGVSARGLALETGLGKPEEFPLFTRFWVTVPGDRLDPLTICALLESPSMIGAYRFDVVPREATVIQVDASLFFRADVEQVGIAPLTSMFSFGPSDRPAVADYRAQVHDSDALAIWRSTGEVLHRPLVNPRELRLSAFSEENPRGFGLVQRERRADAYGDLDARFEQRPNLWVEPRGAWGKGSVRLIEIPTADESRDNIVAFWTPEVPVRAGSEIRLAYTATWTLAGPLEIGLAKVLATAIGQGGDAGTSEERRRGSRRVAIDFSAPAPAAEGAPPLEARVSCQNAECTPPRLMANTLTGGWRVIFDLEPQDGAVELRCFLAHGDRAVSETWLFRPDIG